MTQRVLLVDPNLDDLTAAEGWLREAAYETTAATTFLGAKAAIDAKHFDLLIADVRLGAYNGIHLALLARHRLPRVRSIVTHAARNRTLEAEARRAGAHVFIEKPLTRWSLLSAVEAAMHADAEGPAALRRWPRVRLTKSCQGRIAEEDARLLDVSYGGVRLELARPQEDRAGTLVRLDMVSPALSLNLRPVWVRRSPNRGSWWFGAEIADVDLSAANRWRSFVDSVENSVALA
jgi:CheY-like chemotaxis protein